MRILAVIALVFLFTSCVNEYNFKSVEPYYIFHDNASKVWILNHYYVDGKDSAPLSLNYKRAYVFHSSRNFYENDVQHLGEQKGNKGFFNLKIDEQKLELEYKNLKKVFLIVYLTESKIVLTSTNKAGEKIKLELITFPEY